MPAGKMRCTRRLRSWLVDQVNSGKFQGLEWDNDEKTMFRIPWKHAAKHDFRSDEDAAIFKAWAEFKGKLCEKDPAGPASWKTRLRCALNKSPEFREVPERSQLDITEPYKVYRLVPLDEQGMTELKKEEEEEKDVRRRKQRKKKSGLNEIANTHIKEEESLTAVRNITMGVDDITTHPGEQTELSEMMNNNRVIDEIHLNLTVETTSPLEYKKDSPSFYIRVFYVGKEVLKRELSGDDVRIAVFPASLAPPALKMSGFKRVPLPPPPPDLASSHISSISSLLGFLEGGVALSLSESGIYAKRFCQGRVFWRGPHTPDQIATKMERGVKPTMIFNRQSFRQELERFRNGDVEPETEITLCFGEELLKDDDINQKLIIVKIGLPWAEKQIADARAWLHSVTLLHTLAQQSPSGEITLSLVPVSDDNYTL